MARNSGLKNVGSGKHSGKWTEKTGLDRKTSTGVFTKSTGGISGKLVREATTGRFLATAETNHLRRLSDEGFSKEEIHKLVAPRRTLERRIEKNQPLSDVESDRVMRLERINEHAVRVFGSKEKAHRWLRKPCRALDGAVPIDLLASETGAHIVEEELHAIDHGMFV